MQSDVVTGIEIMGKDCITSFRSLIGPTDPAEAKQVDPRSLRAIFGADGMRNGIHGSGDGVEFERDERLFFSRAFGTTAAFNNCTCCVIKPHIVKDGMAGQVIDMILQEGFEISAMEMFTLDKPTAEEFFEVYKGVLPEFVQMVHEMTVGPCIVLEIR